MQGELIFLYNETLSLIHIGIDKSRLLEEIPSVDFLPTHQL